VRCVIKFLTEYATEFHRNKVCAQACLVKSTNYVEEIPHNHAGLRYLRALTLSSLVLMRDTCIICVIYPL